MTAAGHFQPGGDALLLVGPQGLQEELSIRPGSKPQVVETVEGRRWVALRGKGQARGMKK